MSHIVAVRQDRAGLLMARVWQGVCSCGWASGRFGHRRKAQDAVSCHLAHATQREAVAPGANAP